MLVTETGLHVRDVRTGALTLHTPVEADNPTTRSNDSRVHPSRRLLVRHHEQDRGQGRRRHLLVPQGRGAGSSIPASAFRIRSAFRRMVRSPTTPIPPINILMRVDCDPATGLPTGEPSIFFDQRKDKGGLDGSVVDADGVLWNARWGAASLDAYSPDGRRIRSIAMPARQSSCPAFVGPKADRIAVTSAWQGYDAKAQRARSAGRQDLPGRPAGQGPFRAARRACSRASDEASTDSSSSTNRKRPAVPGSRRKGLPMRISWRFPPISRNQPIWRGNSPTSKAPARSAASTSFRSSSMTPRRASPVAIPPARSSGR